jgi:hypothetical protein
MPRLAAKHDQRVCAGWGLFAIIIVFVLPNMYGVHVCVVGSSVQYHPQRPLPRRPGRHVHRLDAGWNYPLHPERAGLSTPVGGAPVCW